MKFSIKFLAFAVALFCTLPAQVHADLIWTGAGDSISLYQEANWLDDNGLVPGANEINPNTLISAATGGVVRIDGGNGSPSNFGGNFVIGNNDLILGGGKTLRSVSLAGINTTGSSITVTDASTLQVQFIVNADIQVSGGSTMRFGGGGIPVNGSTIDFLDTDSILQFDNETYADFDAEHASKVTFGGASLVFGADPFAFEAGDNAVASTFGANGVQINFTAVPEPASGFLLLPALAFAMTRRRR